MYADEIKAFLERDQSKDNRDEIIQYVGEDARKFKCLMSFFLDDSLHWRYNQRAAWPIGIIARKNPEIIDEYLDLMIDKLGNGRHDSVERNILRILEEIEIPEHLEGILYQKSFELFNDLNRAIAIRVFAMTVLFKIAKSYPEMLEELRESIQMYLPHGSSGFKNRGSKILAKIERILSNL